jgi:hypothetical protein
LGSGVFELGMGDYFLFFWIGEVLGAVLECAASTALRDAIALPTVEESGAALWSLLLPALCPGVLFFRLIDRGWMGGENCFKCRENCIWKLLVVR